MSMILYCNLVQFLSSVLECTKHMFLAMNFVWNRSQSFPTISRWNTPKSLLMTLKAKLSKPMLIHRRQLKSLSVIHDCNRIEFFLPVLECTQHQSLA